MFQLAGDWVKSVIYCGQRMTLQGDTKATDIIIVRLGLRLTFSHKTFSKTSAQQLKSTHYCRVLGKNICRLL
jgi:hypothetical protein